MSTKFGKSGRPSRPALTAIIILLLVAATAQNLSAKDRRAELYFFGRVSTALRVESSDVKDYVGDWSFGGGSGLGIRYGNFHAGVSGGITTSALRFIGWMLLEALGYDNPSYEEIISNYIEFPVRFYSGFNVWDGRDRMGLTLDVFLEGTLGLAMLRISQSQMNSKPEYRFS